MALKQVEARSAGKRSRASDVASQADIMEIAPTAAEIQIARLRKRFDFSPAVAGVVAGLAFATSEGWRGAR